MLLEIGIFLLCKVLSCPKDILNEIEQYALQIEPCGAQAEDHGRSFLITAELGRKDQGICAMH